MNRKAITIFSALIAALIITVAYQNVVIKELVSTVEKQEVLNGKICEVLLEDKVEAFLKKGSDSVATPIAKAE